MNRQYLRLLIDKTMSSWRDYQMASVFNQHKDFFKGQYYAYMNALYQYVPEAYKNAVKEVIHGAYNIDFFIDDVCGKVE